MVAWYSPFWRPLDLEKGPEFKHSGMQVKLLPDPLPNELDLRVATVCQVLSADDVLQKNKNENAEVSMVERIHRIVCKFIMNMIPQNLSIPIPFRCNI
jgi:hypothetical protein